MEATTSGVYAISFRAHEGYPKRNKPSIIVLSSSAVVLLFEVNMKEKRFVSLCMVTNVIATE